MRALPQSFYYFHAYGQRPDPTLSVEFSVPSGNFGNLSAGLLAKRMGLPVQRFVASTNTNDVVPLYLQTGRFEPQPSRSTMSNAMDVGNPSNIVRMQALYHQEIETLRTDVTGVSVTDQETRAAMREIYAKWGYLMDPHGAVAYAGLTAARALKKVADFSIILETAHPSKFGDAIFETLGVNPDIPERLQSCLDGEKRSIRLPAEFSDLKRYLLERA